MFDDYESALGYVRGVGRYPTVIKADGLALGKGVVIAQDFEAAKTALDEMMRGGRFGKSGERVVIEEYLEGRRFPVLAFTDGETVVPMVSSMDHKRALDGDEGPNTGGMGTVAPNPFYTPAVAEACMERIFLPTVRAMKAEGRPFRGCLYFGLMLTKDGPKVIEVQLPLRRPRNAGRAAAAGKRPAGDYAGLRVGYAVRGAGRVPQRGRLLRYPRLRRLSGEIRKGI